jgi:hypothetical protein
MRQHGGIASPMQRTAGTRRLLFTLTRKGGTIMLKTSTIAACVLALSGSVAMAQSGLPNYMPPGPNAAPGGATGAAPANTVGSPSANAQDTLGGGTRSTTILSQTNKNQSAAGMSNSDYSSGAQMQYGTQPMYQNQAQGQGMMAGQDNPRAVAITDEYGNQYNSRGERIGRGRPIR